MLCCKQVKSKDRVKEVGEVFTDSREVNAMLGLIPNITIDMTFLEPTCGNGNFVVEIMKRKFDLCKKKSDYIRALKSVIAIDIMADNIAESKKRIKKMIVERFGRDFVNWASVNRILKKNIVCGDSLEIMKGWDANGKRN